ncbi:MAG: VWA domain-containing protein [Nitrososphaerales archaeon]
MNPTDYAWATLQSLTQKKPNDIKLIVDEIEYPTLERDSHGYILRLSAPRRARDNVMSLHGMYFDSDVNGKTSLWRMFRASIYHLSLHSALTDYGVYRDALSKDVNSNNAMFAISLVEDYALRGLMRAKWPGLMYDTAYANHMSYSQFRNLKDEDAALKAAANLLSYSMIGQPVSSINQEIDQDLEDIHSDLLKVESGLFESLKVENSGSSSLVFESSSSSTQHSAKKELALRIIDFFEERSLYLNGIPSLPFTDNHGPNLLFDNVEPSEERFDTLRLACQELSVLPQEENDKATEIESQTTLNEWEYAISIRQRLVESYRELDAQSHFERILFPGEDYAEFVRTRSKLIGPIRRVLDHLRMVKSAIDEVQGMESGYVDIPTAIQVVASQSARNDVFIREEFEMKSESWAILVDSSKSLESVQGEVKEILVCLAEVARDLIPNPSSWACYAFNENFYVVKDFSELYTNSVKGRIGSLSSGVKTYLPDALRLAANRLAKTNEDVKVLLVASDGFPLGYEGIDEELIRAIEHVTKSGIQLIGLGVGSSSIRKYFKSNCVINHPYDLMNHFVKSYLELSNLF